MQQREALAQILNGYFGYQSRAHGIEDLVQVGRNTPAYHQRTVATLQAGIEAARQGETWVLEYVRKSWLALPNTLAEAQHVLETLLAEYEAAYASSEHQ
jgi:hypothetical protein